LEFKVLQVRLERKEMLEYEEFKACLDYQEGLQDGRVIQVQRVQKVQSQVQRVRMDILVVMELQVLEVQMDILDVMVQQEIQVLRGVEVRVRQVRRLQR
jgi:hypothetical protein